MRPGAGRRASEGDSLDGRCTALPSSHTASHTFVSHFFPPYSRCFVSAGEFDLMDSKRLCVHLIGDAVPVITLLSTLLPTFLLCSFLEAGQYDLMDGKRLCVYLIDHTVSPSHTSSHPFSRPLRGIRPHGQQTPVHVPH